MNSRTPSFLLLAAVLGGFLRSRTLLGVGVGAGALAGGVVPAIGAPEPDPVPRRWQLDLEIGPMRVATVEVRGGGPRSYLYLTYTVANNSGQDLLFAPAFDLATDEGEVIRSGVGVAHEVVRALLNRLDNPFLEDQIGIIDILLQGEENAKEGIVIWPLNDLNVSELNLFAAGFSGETATVDVTNPRTGQPSRMVLRKTLMVRYRVPGELLDLGDRPLDVTDRSWIMR